MDDGAVLLMDANGSLDADAVAEALIGLLTTRTRSRFNPLARLAPVAERLPVDEGAAFSLVFAEQGLRFVVVLRGARIE